MLSNLSLNPYKLFSNLKKIYKNIYIKKSFFLFIELLIYNYKIDSKHKFYSFSAKKIE